MSETKSADALQKKDLPSSTDLEDVWSEEDINLLLDSWDEVMEDIRIPKRKSNAAFRVLQRLRSKGFGKWNEKAVRRQMKLLNMEYKTYLGLKKIGIATVKAKCVPKLEMILGPAAAHLQKTGQALNQPSQRTSVAKESTTTDAKAAIKQETKPDDAGALDEKSGQKRRFQDRLNIQKLMQMQQKILSDVQALQKIKIEADCKTQELLSEIIYLHETSVGKQKRIIEALKALKM